MEIPGSIAERRVGGSRTMPRRRDDMPCPEDLGLVAPHNMVTTKTMDPPDWYLSFGLPPPFPLSLEQDEGMMVPSAALNTGKPDCHARFGR